jgi:hypothetical protein
MRLLGILTAGLILIGIAPSAAADDGPPLRGLRDGGSQVAAGSVVLDRGRGLFGRLSLVGVGWAMSYRDERVDVSQGIGAIGLRGWALPGVWLQAGAGGARDAMGPDATILPAAMIGAGVELGGVDLSCHAGSAVDDHEPRVFHVSLGVSARWY